MTPEIFEAIGRWVVIPLCMLAGIYLVVQKMAEGDGYAKPEYKVGKGK